MKKTQPNPLPHTITTEMQCKLWARSIQPKFPEISVKNSMDRFGPTGKFRKNGSTILGGPLFPVGPVGILVEWIAPYISTNRFRMLKQMAVIFQKTD